MWLRSSSGGFRIRLELVLGPEGSYVGVFQHLCRVGFGVYLGLAQDPSRVGLGPIWGWFKVCLGLV